MSRYEVTERRALIMAIVLVAIASIRIVSTYHVFSFTIDEPGHFACGLQYVSKHVYGYWPEQPPLARAAAALPPYLAGIRPLGEENYNVEGRDLIVKSTRPGRTLALMRLGILPFFWLACGVVFIWCRHYFGAGAALFGVALFTLEPSVLAHAGIACTDMALAATVGAAFLALVLWAESPTVARAALLGLTTGLAVLSKFTALLYLPAAAAIALLFYLAAQWLGLGKLAALVRERAATFALAVLMGAIVIWAGYWFSFGKVPAWNVRLPAPEFFNGLLLARDHNRGGHPSYLLGHFNMKGWWYYFPVALAVKAPIPLLIVSLAGTYICCRRFRISAYRLPIAFSLGVLIPAMAGNVDIGVRHILPIYIGLSILAAVAIGGRPILAAAGFQPASSTVYKAAWPPKRRLRPGLAALQFVLLLWLAISSAIHHPDYLSYFNEFAGHDPSKILVDSNLDWGQDTKRLGRRLRQLGVQEVSVMLIEPLTLPLPVEEAIRRLYGLPRIKPADVYPPHEGWYALSPTVVKTLGLPFKPWWEKIPPTEKVGAVWLYHIPSSSGAAAANAPYIVVWNANGAARNADYTPNQPDNPAAAGSPIMVYVKGAGSALPAVTAAIDGEAAEVLFAGPAPGLTDVGQVDVRIPHGLSRGLHQLVIAVGGVNTNAVEISTK